jgi:hypothetical protein
MTGSGMVVQIGQNVFGYIIPPTERSQLIGRLIINTNKNQIIIIV